MDVLRRVLRVCAVGAAGLTMALGGVCDLAPTPAPVHDGAWYDDLLDGLGDAYDSGLFDPVIAGILGLND